MHTLNEIVDKLFMLLETLEYEGCLSDEEEKTVETLRTEYYTYWAEENHDGEE